MEFMNFEITLKNISYQQKRVRDGPTDTRRIVARTKIGFNKQSIFHKQENDTIRPPNKQLNRYKMGKFKETTEITYRNV